MSQTTIQFARHRTTVLVRLQSPMSHGSFGPSVGNAQLVRRMPIVSLPGMPEVPVLSGAAMRGVLRRLVMRELFARCGLSRDTLPGRKWDRLYGALANGGHLDGSESKADPERIRALREALPPLSVFGAALYSWMLAGHMQSGIYWPRCRETLAAGLVSCGHDCSAEQLVHEVSHARHVDREWQDPTVSGVTPMPTTVEAIGTGAVLEGAIDWTRSATDLERSCVAHGLTMVTHLGGKASSGLGLVSIEHDGDPAPYRAWLDESQETARAALTALAETL